MTQNKHILIKNIYYMLSYAFRALKQSSFENIAVEEFDNAQNLFAAILSCGIGLLLKQGLYREYICVKDDIPLVRGKIDMTGTINHKMARRQVLTCKYDELSENNLFNQVMKATALLLLEDEQVKNEYKSILKKEMLYFSNVDKINPNSVAWNKIRFHRNNQTYRLLMGICRLLLEGMLQTTEEGKNRLNNFVDDQKMHRLYEKFIFEYYRQEFPQLSVAASCIPWALDDGLDDALPQMQSDIMLSHEEKTLIIDAKYYSHTMQMQFDKKTMHSQNLYQIFTYVKNKEAISAQKVSGMLLYARTDEATQPNHTYQMSGNRIDVKTLDLNCEFRIISEQLDSIAKDFFGIAKGVC